MSSDASIAARLRMADGMRRSSSSATTPTVAAAAPVTRPSLATSRSSSTVRSTGAEAPHAPPPFVPELALAPLLAAAPVPASRRRSAASSAAPSVSGASAAMLPSAAASGRALGPPSVSSRSSRARSSVLPPRPASLIGSSTTAAAAAAPRPLPTPQSQSAVPFTHMSTTERLEMLKRQAREQLQLADAAAGVSSRSRSRSKSKGGSSKKKKLSAASSSGGQSKKRSSRGSRSPSKPSARLAEAMRLAAAQGLASPPPAHDSSPSKRRRAALEPSPPPKIRHLSLASVLSPPLRPKALSLSAPRPPSTAELLAAHAATARHNEALTEAMQRMLVDKQQADAAAEEEATRRATAAASPAQSPNRLRSRAGFGGSGGSVSGSISGRSGGSAAPHPDVVRAQQATKLALLQAQIAARNEVNKVRTEMERKQQQLQQQWAKEQKATATAAAAAAEAAAAAAAASAARTLPGLLALRLARQSQQQQQQHAQQPTAAPSPPVAHSGGGKEGVSSATSLNAGAAGSSADALLLSPILKPGASNSSGAGDRDSSHSHSNNHAGVSFSLDLESFAEESQRQRGADGEPAASGVESAAAPTATTVTVASPATVSTGVSTEGAAAAAPHHPAVAPPANEESAPTAAAAAPANAAAASVPSAGPVSSAPQLPTSAPPAAPESSGTDTETDHEAAELSDDGGAVTEARVREPSRHELTSVEEESDHRSVRSSDGSAQQTAGAARDRLPLAELAELREGTAAATQSAASPPADDAAAGSLGAAGTADSSAPTATVAESSLTTHHPPTSATEGAAVSAADATTASRRRPGHSRSSSASQSSEAAGGEAPRHHSASVAARERERERGSSHHQRRSSVSSTRSGGSVDAPSPRDPHRRHQRRTSSSSGGMGRHAHASPATAAQERERERKVRMGAGARSRYGLQPVPVSPVRHQRRRSSVSSSSSLGSARSAHSARAADGAAKHHRSSRSVDHSPPSSTRKAKTGGKSSLSTPATNKKKKKRSSSKGKKGSLTSTDLTGLDGALALGEGRGPFNYADWGLATPPSTPPTPPAPPLSDAERAALGFRHLVSSVRHSEVLNEWLIDALQHWRRTSLRKLFREWRRQQQEWKHQSFFYQWREATRTRLAQKLRLYTLARRSMAHWILRARFSIGLPPLRARWFALRRAELLRQCYDSWREAYGARFYQALAAYADQMRVRLARVRAVRTWAGWIGRRKALRQLAADKIILVRRKRWYIRWHQAINLRVHRALNEARALQHDWTRLLSRSTKKWKLELGVRQKEAQLARLERRYAMGQAAILVEHWASRVRKTLDLRHNFEAVTAARLARLKRALFQAMWHWFCAVMFRRDRQLRVHRGRCVARWARRALHPDRRAARALRMRADQVAATRRHDRIHSMIEHWLYHKNVRLHFRAQTERGVAWCDSRGALLAVAGYWSSWKRAIQRAMLGRTGAEIHRRNLIWAKQSYLLRWCNAYRIRAHKAANWARARRICDRFQSRLAQAALTQWWCAFEHLVRGPVNLVRVRRRFRIWKALRDRTAALASTRGPSRALAARKYLHAWYALTAERRGMPNSIVARQRHQQLMQRKLDAMAARNKASGLGSFGLAGGEAGAGAASSDGPMSAFVTKFGFGLATTTGATGTDTAGLPSAVARWAASTAAANPGASSVPRSAAELWGHLHLSPGSSAAAGAAGADESLLDEYGDGADLLELSLDGTGLSNASAPTAEDARFSFFRPHSRGGTGTAPSAAAIANSWASQRGQSKSAAENHAQPAAAQPPRPPASASDEHKFLPAAADADWQFEADFARGLARIERPASLHGLGHGLDALDEATLLDDSAWGENGVDADVSREFEGEVARQEREKSGHGPFAQSAQLWAPSCAAATQSRVASQSALGAGSPVRSRSKSRSRLGARDPIEFLTPVAASPALQRRWATHTLLGAEGDAGFSPLFEDQLLDAIISGTATRAAPSLILKASPLSLPKRLGSTAAVAKRRGRSSSTRRARPSSGGAVGGSGAGAVSARPAASPGPLRRSSSIPRSFGSPLRAAASARVLRRPASGAPVQLFGSPRQMGKALVRQYNTAIPSVGSAGVSGAAGPLKHVDSLLGFSFVAPPHLQLQHPSQLKAPLPLAAQAKSRAEKIERDRRERKRRALEEQTARAEVVRDALGPAAMTNWPTVAVANLTAAAAPAGVEALRHEVPVSERSAVSHFPAAGKSVRRAAVSRGRADRSRSGGRSVGLTPSRSTSRSRHQAASQSRSRSRGRQRVHHAQPTKHDAEEAICAEALRRPGLEAALDAILASVSAGKAATAATAAPAPAFAPASAFPLPLVASQGAPPPFPSLVPSFPVFVAPSTLRPSFAVSPALSAAASAAAAGAAAGWAVPS